MPPLKHTTTNHSPSHTFKHQILLCLHKLSDRDTHSAAASELESIAKSLPHSSIPPFLSSISSTDSSDKSPVRKQCICLISTLSQSHGDVLSPHLSKLLSAIIRRLRDPDSAVRTACVNASGSIAANVTKPPFMTVAKPFVDALVTEQDLNGQIGAALCLAAVIDGAPEPDRGYLRRLMPRIEKLLKSDGFRAKSALLTVVGSVVDVGAVSSKVIVRNLVRIMTEFVVRSEDWCVRKAAAEVLERLAVVEAELLPELKEACLKTFEAKKFDKVKCVRETMIQMVEAWNAVPDLPEEMSPLQESHSAKEESDIQQQQPRTPHMINNRSVSNGSSTGTGSVTRRDLLVTSSRKTFPTRPAMFCKLDRKKPSDQKLNTAEVHNIQRPVKHETRRVLFGEIFDEKTHDESSQDLEGRPSSRVVGNNDSTSINEVQLDSEDLSLIRNQLAQIETQQSNLFNLLEKFIGSSMNGMQSLESRVRGVELTLDEISFDLAKSNGQLSNPEPTLCCKLPGSDLLSSKRWKKSEIQQSYMRNHSPESLKNKELGFCNLRTTGLNVRSGCNGLIKNPLAEASSQM